MNIQELREGINSLPIDIIKDIYGTLEREILNPSNLNHKQHTTWYLLALQDYGNKEEKLWLETYSLNKILNTHKSVCAKKHPIPTLSWGIISCNRQYSKRSGEKISEHLHNEKSIKKRDQFETKIKNMGYAPLYICGEYSECKIPNRDLKECPENKKIIVPRLMFFIPNISFKDICKLSNQLYLDIDWDNNKTNKEKSRFGQDSFIYAGEETNYDAWIYSGKDFNQIQKFANVIEFNMAKKYSVITHNYITLDAYLLPAGGGELRIKYIYDKIKENNNKKTYSMYLYPKILQFPIRIKKELLKFLKYK